MLVVVRWTRCPLCCRRRVMVSPYVQRNKRGGVIYSINMIPLVQYRYLGLVQYMLLCTRCSLIYCKNLLYKTNFSELYILITSNNLAKKSVKYYRYTFVIISPIYRLGIFEIGYGKFHTEHSCTLSRYFYFASKICKISFSVLTQTHADETRSIGRPHLSLSFLPFSHVHTIFQEFASHLLTFG